MPAVSPPELGISPLGADKGSFRAFISYSHSDSDAAKWLHRQLEAYRVPARLVGRSTATGVVGARIGKVFRDREELTVSADLSGKINHALQRSQFLVVLCSAASAKSKWVNQEIINFKRLKGADSIIAVILEGEPFASNLPGRAHEECFPPALRFEVTPDGAVTDRPAEPVAADLRPGKDGKRLVRMKVLSGLLGVELDELIRREVQRRNRQLFAVSCIMGAVVVAMGVLSILAVTSRNQAIAARDDARRQKDQAEGLIDFMLGDLRDKLKPVGRLDSLEAVGGRAARYFESLHPGEFDSETRARLARTKLLTGEVLHSQGKAAEAGAAFDQAYTMTSALYAAEPDKNDAIFNQAQSEYWVGYGKFRNARYSEAEQNFLTYQELAKRLTDRQPSNLVWQAELASALTNLGVVQSRLLRLSEALEKFKLAAETQNRVIASQPELASFANEIERSRQRTKLVGLYSDLGQMLAWEADTEAGVGRISNAVALRERELQVYRDSEALDPRNTAIAQARWVAARARGRLLLESGDPAAALADFESAITIAEALVRQDQENKRWAQLLARCQLDAADALLDLGRLEESRKRIDVAVSTGREMTRSANINRAVKIQLMGNSLLLSAREHFARKVYEPAGRDLGELSRLVAEILSGTPNEPETLLLKSESEILAGDIDQSSGRIAAAQTHWRAAADIRGAFGDGANTKAAVLAARALARLQDGQARPLREQVCASGYRRGEFKSLCP